MALRHEPFEECRCCDRAASDLDVYKREILSASETVNVGAKTFMVVPEVKSEMDRLHDGHAIVDRVWKALGISDYAGAKGKAIDELVAEAVEKAWRYDQLNK